MLLALGLANPLAVLAPAPFSPYGMGTPVLGGLVHPGLQMAPNLLSHQHRHYMANPYLGGPAAGNPYLQPSLPNPFAPPGFAPGLPFGGGYGPALPAVFPVTIGPMPSPMASPVPGLRIAQPPAPPLPFDPASWFGPFARPAGR
jgi:hypothetical protein